MSWERRLPPVAEDALDMLYEAVEDGDDTDGLPKDEAKAKLCSSSTTSSPTMRPGTLSTCSTIAKIGVTFIPLTSGSLSRRPTIDRWNPGNSREDTDS
jgi:hypothetical protein